jgi:hypothetical protein
MENTIENLPSPDKKNSARRNADNHFVTWERRTALVKQQATAASAHNDAKTDRLRALRLAKEAADREAAPEAPPKRAAAKRRIVIKA